MSWHYLPELVGGLLASILAGHRTVAAVEVEPYCREQLLRRQRDGVLPLFPIWDDIRTFDGRPWRGVVDLVTAGFPCQPFSQAGKGRAEKDDRNLWPETMRVIREVGPEFVLLENSPRLRSFRYFGTILGQLSESGYRVPWDCVPASAVGADHQRDRLWIACDKASDSERHPLRDLGERIRQQRRLARPSELGDDGEDQPVPDGDGGRREEGGLSEHAREQGEQRCLSHGLRGARGVSRREPPGPQGWWQSEPDVGRVVDGLAYRVDRIRALGNGQVPAVASLFLREA